MERTKVDVENQSHGCIIYKFKYNQKENQVHLPANVRTVCREDNTALLDNYPTSIRRLVSSRCFLSFRRFNRECYDVVFKINVLVP